MSKQCYINHVALVLDASGSMDRLSRQVVEVADNQVKQLAVQSNEFSQETRATVYTFQGGGADCVFYDTDVLRMPSIKGQYSAWGGTPLIGSTLKAIEDLQKTATLYGDHSFLLFIVTDGLATDAKRSMWNPGNSREDELKEVLGTLPDHWTVAALVPNGRGVSQMEMLGFAPGNIQVWDTTSEGLDKLDKRMSVVTRGYMDARSKGTKGSKDVFSLTAEDVKVAVSQGKLEITSPRDYVTMGITPSEDGSKRVINSFVEQTLGLPYERSRGFYQLSKRETIGRDKKVVIRNKRTFDVYQGRVARQMLGLADEDVKMKPTDNPDFDIFIESTSTNRVLVPNLDLIYFP